jgi:hypothetical protein
MNMRILKYGEKNYQDLKYIVTTSFWQDDFTSQQAEIHNHN